MRLIIDTNILGKICHPKKNQEIAKWFIELLTIGNYELFLPEISDYELRRELLRLGSEKSLERLNKLAAELHYLPIETSHMKKAAELWADARSTGKPTAPMEALDGDVILAAQALSIEATVLTENKKHLERFVNAKTWLELMLN